MRKVLAAGLSVAVLAGCGGPQGEAETTAAIEAEPDTAPEQPADMTAAVTDLEWGPTSGSCDKRAESGVCTDLEEEPRGAELCPGWGGAWSESPCPPPDWGSCFMGGGQVNRYFSSEVYDTADTAREACGIVGGSWTPMASP